MAQTIDTPIEDLVPHDRPMALLDEMVSYTDQRSVCKVTIHPDSMFAGPYGVPSYVGIEYMAQAIAAHGGYRARLAGQPIKVGFLLGTPKLTSNCDNFPMNHTLKIEVVEDWGDDELRRFQCKVIDAESGEVLQETGLNVFQPKDLEQYLGGEKGAGS